MEDYLLDELVEQIDLTMSDGIDDVWLNVPTEALRAYMNQELVKELEELERRIKKGQDPIKVIDQRILQAVGLESETPPAY